MSQEIPIHLQGYASYDYECRKADCLYCQVMLLTPAPDIYKEPVKIIVIDPVYENAPPRKLKRIRVKKEKVILPPPAKKEIWTAEKVEYLLNNYHRLSNIDLSIKLHLSEYLIRMKMTEIGLKRVIGIRVAHFDREPDLLSNNYNGWF
ncbi:MAG TPA: hypothetical protein VN922_24680 [Bacteroidia bacterium]|nr:hypothetical protein [Bacteroidia bacterium]